MCLCVGVCTCAHYKEGHSLCLLACYAERVLQMAPTYTRLVIDLLLAACL